MTIRLVATDLDGTFFGEDHRPHPRNVAAINALVDQGVVAAAVTGRSYFGGLELATSTGAQFEWFIGSNGGHRVRVADRHLEERLVFVPDELAATVTQLGNEIPGLGFGYELDQGFYFDDAFLEYFPRSVDGGPRRSTVERFNHDDIGKFFVAHPEVRTNDLVELIAPHVPESMFPTTSGLHFVEVTPKGGDKGSALARLCDKLGIDATEVVAFGDNYNDVTMLEWAGRGVAMHNADDGVKAIADEVTGNNADGGVAEVLESLVA